MTPEQERDNCKETARQFSMMADYWRERAARSERALAAAVRELHGPHPCEVPGCLCDDGASYLISEEPPDIPAFWMCKAHYNA